MNIMNNEHNEEDNVVDSIDIKCINFNKFTGLHIKNTSIEGMITKYVCNAILHHVGMPWIICSKNEML